MQTPVLHSTSPRKAESHCLIVRHGSHFSRSCLIKDFLFILQKPWSDMRRTKERALLGSDLGRQLCSPLRPQHFGPPISETAARAFPRPVGHLSWEGPHLAEETEAGWGRLAQSGQSWSTPDRRPPRSLPRAPGKAAHLCENLLNLILCCHPLSVELVGHRPFFKKTKQNKKNSGPNFPPHRALLCKAVLDTNRTKAEEFGASRKMGEDRQLPLRESVVESREGSVKTLLFVVGIFPFENFQTCSSVERLSEHSLCSPRVLRPRPSDPTFRRVCILPLHACAVVSRQIARSYVLMPPHL